jgi:hypothetical protein
MLLLVKTEGAWRIVSQAWDTEGPSKRIPRAPYRRRGAVEG